MKYYIYKISIPNTEYFYIGSTNNLYNRKSHHKDYSLYYFNPKFMLYDKIREYGGWDKIEFTTIKEFEVNSKKEASIEEQKIIDELKPNLNNRMASRHHLSIEEKNKLNKESTKKSAKKYYQNMSEEDKNKRKEYMRIYYLNRKNLKEN